MPLNLLSARRRGLKGKRRKRRKVEERQASTGPTQSEVSDARKRRKNGWWVLIHRKAEGTRDQSYPLTIGMEGVIE